MFQHGEPMSQQNSKKQSHKSVLIIICIVLAVIAYLFLSTDNGNPVVAVSDENTTIYEQPQETTSETPPATTPNKAEETEQPPAVPSVAQNSPQPEPEPIKDQPKQDDTAQNSPQPPTTQNITLRIMTANTTSGEDQSYDNGEGIRIFKALRPDVVLIQEFNYNKGNITQFVNSTFGKDFHYYRGKGRIPNGIISRYPIKSSGGWPSNQVSDRQWEWAVVDLPGDRDLLAISVHLYTQNNEAEMVPLLRKIQQKIEEDKQNYYIILGGDFNQSNWTPIQKNFSSMFVVGSRYADWPADQEGMVKTNATRHKQIDYLLCSPDLCRTEVPITIGKHKYPRGHVVDSRLYQKLGELSDIAPVKAEDSAAEKMQHMAVIRDFNISY